FSIANEPGVKERGTADAWAADLQRLAAAVNDPQAMRVLMAPNLSLQQKQRALETAGGSLSREVITTLSLLLARKRIDQLPALAEAFADLVREEKGISLAEVTSAVPLSDADRQSVGRWLATYLGHA